MSLKNKRKSPRAMPVETIVTRYKSAQMKRQLREKPKKKEVKQKVGDVEKPLKANLPKVKTDNSSTVENNEFYPNKMKRKNNVKKIVLIPKHDYKIVASNYNKRKINTPRKDIRRKHSNSTSSSNSDTQRPPKEYTMTEMIKLIEDTGNFDDEDLMEILTCPSPVWWEDPPDGYTEDPISQTNTQVQESQNEDTNNSVEPTKMPIIVFEEDIISCTEKLEVKKFDVNLKINDPDIIKKRGKLETLLDNLKKAKNVDSIQNRCNIDNSKPIKTNSKEVRLDIFLNSTVEDTILDNLENMDIPIDTNNDRNNCEIINLSSSGSESDLLVLNNSEKTTKLKLNTKRRRNKSERFMKMDTDYNAQSIVQSTDSTIKHLESQTSDFVTVYKIINSDYLDDVTENTSSNDCIEKTGQLNSYYKQCKNLRRYK